MSAWRHPTLITPTREFSGSCKVAIELQCLLLHVYVFRDIKRDIGSSYKSLLLWIVSTHNPASEFFFTYLVFLPHGSSYCLFWFVIWEANEVCAVYAVAKFPSGFYKLERYTTLRGWQIQPGNYRTSVPELLF